MLAGGTGETQRHMATPAEAGRLRVLLLALRANHEVSNILSAEPHAGLRAKAAPWRSVDREVDQGLFVIDAKVTGAIVIAANYRFRTGVLGLCDEVKLPAERTR